MPESFKRRLRTRLGIGKLAPPKFVGWIMRYVGPEIIGKICGGRIREDGEESPLCSPGRGEVVVRVIVDVRGDGRYTKGMRDDEREGGILAPPVDVRRISDDLHAWTTDRRRLQHSEMDIGKGRRAVERIAADCGWKTRADIHQADAPSWLARMMEGGWKSKTHDNHVDYLRRFGRTMVDLGHWADSPFESLGGVGHEPDQGMGAFTFAEAWGIINAAKEQGLTHFCRWPRWTLYVFLLYTGLRIGEAEKVRVDDVRIDQEYPQLLVRKEVAKNRRRWLLPLHPVVIDAIRVVIADPGTVRNARRAQGRLFPAMPADQTIHNDMLAADVSKMSPEGESRCYHSFRKTFETTMASCGMHDRYPDYFMRHLSAIKVRYFKPTPELLAKEIAKYPGMPPNPEMPKTYAPPSGGENGGNSQPPHEKDLTRGGDIVEDDSVTPMQTTLTNTHSTTGARNLGHGIGVTISERPKGRAPGAVHFSEESAPDGFLAEGTGVKRRGGDSNPRSVFDPCVSDLLAAFEAQLAGIQSTARMIRQALTQGGQHGSQRSA